LDEATDHEAIAAANPLVGGHDVEVWDRGRKLATLPSLDKGK
jgi:hypothetical protein